MEHEYNPPKLNFEDSSLSVEERFDLVTAMLQEYECVVTFTKVDGELRTMPCTLKEDILPVASQVIKEDVTTGFANKNVITAWCTDKNAWRAMRTANIKTVELKPMKWTLTVEEDPETGEALLQFPPELLELAGWKEGDKLKWKDLGDGSWSIEKSN